MEVLPAAAGTAVVTMVEDTMVDQEHIQGHDQVHFQDHIIQDTHVMAVTEDHGVMVMVDMEEVDQDGHITGDQDVDGSAVNIGTGTIADGFHTGHSHTRSQATDFTSLT